MSKIDTFRAESGREKGFKRLSKQELSDGLKTEKLTLMKRFAPFLSDCKTGRSEPLGMYFS